ncbi:hypothetical protein EVG20_g1225 [Dentipellis fragilis]|uniref:Major facilitator superfamily (MFS) profile domain-containing protein n=1 Tax=Dentipellis fragilis TaxID=205917 RepID=A0A4Y9ZCQ1_9AGAM|nr:hypothetical protein EVG20_g1225 [Dentipellis fragilis]
MRFTPRYGHQTHIHKYEAKNRKQSSRATLVDKATEQNYEVTLEPEEDPQQASLFRKWLAVFVISTSAICVACDSSAAAFTEEGISEEFGVSRVVAILGISLFIQGLGIGPLLVGPLSEIYGRQIIYRVSFFLYFATTWPIAFAPHISVFLIFRFVSGFCAAAFFCVTAGSMSDMFSDAEVATPMAINTIAPFIGPELEPIYSGFINQNTNWRWTYYTLLIWIFIDLVAIVFFVPETFVPIILKRKAQRLRKATGDEKYYAPIERKSKDIFRAILISCSKPFQLLFHDRMVLFLNLWNSLILGILYLAFQAFPIIFEENHGFNMQMTGLTFIGILSGMLIGLSTQPYWNSRYKRHQRKHGEPLPEYRLWTGRIGGVLVPVSLFCLAFTTYSHVHWIAPIIVTVPFGIGVYFVFTSTFTYLVVAYRPMAASVMASNTAMRTSFAAGFPLFAPAMYHKLGTVGATALLAGLTTVMAPFPFIFYRYGAQFRERSKFAVSSAEHKEFMRGRA